MADNIRTKNRDDNDLDIASKDVAGVQIPRNIIVDGTGAEIAMATEATAEASRVLLTGVATEATLAARLPTLTASIPLDHSSGMPVRQIPADLWRCSFSDVGSGLQTTDLTTLQTGTGQAISQSAGNLVITSGTTANAETLLRSTRTFNGAMQIRYKTILSQRIANNNFSVEMADLVGTSLAYAINSSTSVTVTFPASTNPFTAKNVGQFVNLSCITGAAGIPGRFAIASTSGDTVTFTVVAWPGSGSGTLMLWGWNYFRALYTGTTATNVAFDCQRKGWATGDSTLTINTTASPGHVGHIQSNASLVGYSDALVATNAAYQFTPRCSRIENIPDDGDSLYLFIRVLNGTTNPASTTTWTIGFVSVEMTGRQKVYVSGADQAGATFATAVQVVGGVLSTQPVSGTVTATVTGATQLPVTPTTAFTNSAATTNATSTKASAGTVWSVVVSNINAAARYLKLYNKASAPTVGTDTPVIVVPIPAGQVVKIDGGSNGIRFATGIAWALTAGAADSDTAAVSANEHKVAITYT